MDTLERLNEKIVHCAKCPRLRRHCRAVAKEKKREFREWEYWGKPVPGFGDPSASLWIVGLAPAAHGANRTGRMFTGDSSGRWLYRALHLTGFANQPDATDRKDGLVLHGAYISAACRCAPPDNKPSPTEIRACEPFLDAEFQLLKKRRIILVLGQIAHKAVLDLLRREGSPVPSPRPKFGHGALHSLGEHTVLCSYHPSRQNTQTGRLTEQMWFAIFEKARELVS